MKSKIKVSKYKILKYLTNNLLKKMNLSTLL